ncbi:hypothetical protein ACC718_11785 [Rhizobium ruizarguesonis]|jgi:hypothetical protein|uniref:hypothetical protein n=1 Tax=Rhizobium ruizarguesonis TaxID=2081791 RepID=UPI0013DFA8D9|nr:hypothetical protein [Rhizobium ruizarguesonis]NEJ95181.1 hypothetical protein [Rhizobium ruizarguesonis]
MPVTREQFRFGAWIAALSAVVALLTAVVTLYTQVSQIVEASVLDRFRRDFAPIGTIVSSILPPVDFAEATGEKEADTPTKRTWILADGRDVSGSKYATTTHLPSVPNMQGMFLRGLARVDARKPGEFQDYATALPRQALTGTTGDDGEHTHGSGAVYSKTDKYDVPGGPVRSVGVSPTDPAGLHHHSVSINGGGDSETRPPNVAVYFYIKIN